MELYTGQIGQPIELITEMDCRDADLCDLLGKLTSSSSQLLAKLGRS